jgi:hypothetical protein
MALPNIEIEVPLHQVADLIPHAVEAATLPVRVIQDEAAGMGQEVCHRLKVIRVEVDFLLK